ncbi:MAG: hypothetical protein IKC69_05315 [Clostridia bacterium]|nr:hypothetical protein [Clostridia bacterium]
MGKLGAVDRRERAPPLAMWGFSLPFTRLRRDEAKEHPFRVLFCVTEDLRGIYGVSPHTPPNFFEKKFGSKNFKVNIIISFLEPFFEKKGSKPPKKLYRGFNLYFSNKKDKKPLKSFWGFQGDFFQKVPLVGCREAPCESPRTALCADAKTAIRRMAVFLV